MVAPAEGDARRRGSRSRAWSRAAGRPVLRTSTLQVEQLEECCQPALLTTSAALPYAVAPSLPTAPNQVTLDHATWAATANSPLQFRSQLLPSSLTGTTPIARGPTSSSSGQVSVGQFRLASKAPLHTPLMSSQTQVGPILNSATSIGTLATFGPQGIQSSQTQLVFPSGLTQGQRLELIIVDPRVMDFEQLIADMTRNAPSRRLEVVILRPDRDGLRQVTDILARYQQLHAVHLISHGAANGVAIGNTWLSSLNIGSYSQQFQQWQLALAAHADLLFYACNLAQNESGQNLLRDIGQWTGADVAASADATGSSVRGGNWRLEYSSGYIESAVPITLQAQSTWRGLLPVLATSLNQRVNLTTAGVQDTAMENRGSQNAIALADNGKYVVVWSSQNQDGSGWGVYGQCFNPNGNSRGGEFRINQTTSNDQRWANVACDSNGNFVVTWTSENQDGTPTSVYARAFSSTGATLTSEFRVNTTATGTQKNSGIAMDRATGDFVITWAGEGPGDTAGIFFRRFNAGGTAKDAADQLANLVDGGTENDPAIAMTAGGEFVITWEVNKHIYFQRFDGAGVMQSASLQVDNLLSTSSRPSVASDATGTFTVAYRQDTLFTGVWIKGFHSDGSTHFGWQNVASGDADSPSVAMASTGEIIVTYHKTGDGSGLGVYGQHYDFNGGAIGGAFAVNQYTNGNQSNSSLAMLDSNDVVVVWSGEGSSSGPGPGDPNGIFVRQFGGTNVAPIITSNGGGNSTSITTPENTTAVTTVTAIDADLPAQKLRYAITGGLDAARFTINSNTGVLTFIAAPNFEVPIDVGADNKYEVQVEVSDGSLTDNQTIAVTIINVNETPVGIADNYTVLEDGNLTTQASWFNNAWTKRNVITFNNLSGPALFNHVVLVEIDSSKVDYLKTQNGGQDLRFVDADGTLLDYEIELWNESGTSTVWVRVPQIDAASNTDSICMYYGNASATDAQNPAGVWVNGAQAVLHLQGPIVDSSPNALTVTVSRTNSVTGFIANGRRFDGVDGAINLGSSPITDNLFAGGGTVSAWINPAGWGENGFGRIVSHASTTFAFGALGDGWSFKLDGSNRCLIFEQGATLATGRWQTLNDSIALNTWHMVTVIYDSSSLANDPRIFIDGVEVAVIESNTPTGVITSDAGLNLIVGNDATTTTRTFDGVIDEVRAFNVSLTPEQIRADFESMTRLLATIGVAQSGLGGVLINDYDPDRNKLTAILVSGTSNGSLVFNADGSFVYTPNINFNGIDTFTYQANDGALNSSVVTVTINVIPVNDAPVAIVNGYTVNEDTTLTVAANGVLGNDVDFDGNALSAVLVSGTSNGTLVFNADGSFIYTPNADFNGFDSFSYRAYNGISYSNRAIVTIRINPVNEMPIAVGDTFSVAEDGVLTISSNGVLINDSDVDGDPIKAILVGGPSFGTVTLNSDGSFTYSPNRDFNGTDTFTYVANDGTTASNLATVTINVKPVNDAPAAANDIHLGREDTKLIVSTTSVLDNDKDIDGDTLRVTLQTGPRHGMLLLNADGTFTYTPDTNYNGLDSFTYMAHDGLASSFAATVVINLTPVNDAPIAIADSYSITSDKTLKIAVAGVLSNDSDVDNKQLTATLVGSTYYGTVTLQDDGSFFYIPNAKFHGTDTFTYRANDGLTQSKLVTVTIDVTAAVVVTPPLVTSGGPLQPIREIPPTTIEPTPTNQNTPTTIVNVGPLVLGGTTGSSDSESAMADAALVLAQKPANPFAAVVTAPNPLGDRNIAGDRSSTSLTIHTPSPAAPLPTRSVVNLTADNPVFTALDQVSKDVRSEVKVQVVADAVVATGVVVSAGYVLLNTKIVYWFISALLVRPAVWTRFDPIDVLYAWDEGRDDEPEGTSDDESLQSMVS